VRALLTIPRHSLHAESPIVALNVPAACSSTRTLGCQGRRFDRILTVSSLTESSSRHGGKKTAQLYVMQSIMLANTQHTKPTLRTGDTPVAAPRLSSRWIGDAGRVQGVDSLATRAAQALGLSPAGRVASTRACSALSFIRPSLCAAGLAGDDCVGSYPLVARGGHCGAHSQETRMSDLQSCVGMCQQQTVLDGFGTL
jgi:hypothetical protein